MTYDEAVMKSKDAAVEFGFNSWQYQTAINEMQVIYRNTPKPFSYKVINLFNRIKWLLTKR